MTVTVANATYSGCLRQPDRHGSFFTPPKNSSLLLLLLLRNPRQPLTELNAPPGNLPRLRANPLSFCYCVILCGVLALA